MRTTITTLIFVFFTLFAFAGNGGGSGSQDKRAFSTMHAVLVVGPQEDGTREAMRKMDAVAAVFQKQGVKVHKFYNTNADWEEIKKVSPQANFFVYSGHGGTRGGGGKSGGLTLTTSVGSREILEELKLADKAMVIFKSVCRGAGSSAGDDEDIGIKEATTRVSDYALPFFEIGASAYYANNLGHGCVEFLENFFEGKTLHDCFETTANTWTKIELTENYAYDKNRKIAIASTDWGGTATRITYINGKKKVEKIPAVKNYEIAYVGKNDLKVWDLLK